tara:strand:- start:577 stop:711 length:135 start_codon:yes stop_codon:yes gene_type:complete
VAAAVEAETRDIMGLVVPVPVVIAQVFPGSLLEEALLRKVLKPL